MHEILNCSNDKNFVYCIRKKLMDYETNIIIVTNYTLVDLIRTYHFIVCFPMQPFDIFEIKIFSFDFICPLRGEACCEK